MKGATDARRQFDASLARPDFLRRIAQPGRGCNRIERDHLYATCLVTLVAAWDSFVNGIVRNYWNATARPWDAAYTHLHGLGRENMEEGLRRFNVPNFENSRTLIARHTGLDVIQHWSWPERSINVTEVRERLNEALRLRHSIAHGSISPNIIHLLPNGAQPLSAGVTGEVRSLLVHLVKKSDVGMRNHINLMFDR